MSDINFDAMFKDHPFRFLAESGRAVLEDRNRPTCRMSTAPRGKRWDLEALKEEARHNPRLKLRVRADAKSELFEIPYEGPRPEVPQKEKKTMKTKPVTVQPIVAPSEQPDASALLIANVEIARAIIEMCQAIRDSAHASAMDAMRAQLADLRRAWSTEHEALDRTYERAEAPRALACYRCHKPATMGYILDGKVCCRDCREAHRVDYYASRGQVARPRTDRRARSTRVEQVTVYAERCDVARAS